MKIPGFLQPKTRTSVQDGFLQNTGLIDSSTEVRVHRNRDGVDHSHDEVASREVQFKNGLVLRGDKERVSVLQGDKVVARYPGATLELPTAEKPNVTISQGWNNQEHISPQGAVQVSWESREGGPATVLTLEQNTAHGELIDTVPSVNSIFEGFAGDEEALKAGIKGFYADDVGNHYYIHDVKVPIGANGVMQFEDHPPIQAWVTPEQLGNPQAAPLPVNVSWPWSREEFTPDGQLQTTKESETLGMGDAHFFNQRDTLPQQVTRQWSKTPVAPPPPPPTAKEEEDAIINEALKKS